MMLYASNGEMVFTYSYPGKVVILHKDGSRHYAIDIRSGYPYDVTCIDSNTIAVSVVEAAHQVHIIDLNNRLVTQKIITGTYLFGLTYNDGFLICCGKDKGLIRIDLKDHSITPVVRCSLPAWPHVTTNSNNIYYTKYTEHT